MSETSVLDDLARYGPQKGDATAPTADEAALYCRRLAHSHYENFTVASTLLPRRLRQHFYNVYAYCRWSDDLADETGSPDESLKLLAWWEQQLQACYEGEARHPVFVALRPTIEQFAIPIEPFADLLVAFRQDQGQTRYETFDDLLGYCRNSANPVGRLVLYLGGCHDEQRGQLADSICTGLQLANFWQDVARDWNDRARVYLPQNSCRRHGYDESMFEKRTTNDAFRALMAEEVDRAEGFLRAGMPLVNLVPSWLQLDVELFARGGLAVLRGIKEINYDVWRVRPTVSRGAKFRLLAGCLVRRWRNRLFGFRRAGGSTRQEVDA